MVQNLRREILGRWMGQVLANPAGVEAGFVHAHQADGGEVVVEGAQIVLRIGVQPLIQQLGDDGPLDFQAAGRNVHHMVQPLVKFLLVPDR